ncbi:MAG: class I SAM-dependent methyltransferase [Muribaculaceae bacterium]|nr:class I SAM-dependent methyltransferase [Muribaculaceae bacterium]
MREKIVLSQRLKAAAGLVTRGNRVCDVGCDHGFVPIYLILEGISPRALALDVREGPLEQAREHIKAYRLEAYIETRLSDGLCAYRCGEADSFLCAGMGGRLMQRILETDKDKTDSFRELILQPQSEIEQFRRFLRGQGYLLVEENMIEEDGKFYPMMKAVKGKKKSLPYGESKEALWYQRMEDRYGPHLLAERHPVLCRYIQREAHICEEILKQLETSGLEDVGRLERYREKEIQRQDCLRVLRDIYGYEET